MKKYILAIMLTSIMLLSACGVAEKSTSNDSLDFLVTTKPPAPPKPENTNKEPMPEGTKVADAYITNQGENLTYDDLVEFSNLKIRKYNNLPNGISPEDLDFVSEWQFNKDNTLRKTKACAIISYNVKNISDIKFEIAYNSNYLMYSATVGGLGDGDQVFLFINGKKSQEAKDTYFETLKPGQETYVEILYIIDKSLINAKELYLKMEYPYLGEENPKMRFYRVTDVTKIEE